MINILEMIQKPKIKVLFIPLAEPNSMQLGNKRCRQELTKIFVKKTLGETVFTLNQKSHEIQIWNTKDMEFEDNVLPFACRHKDIVIVARFLNQKHKCERTTKDFLRESDENMRENIFGEGQDDDKPKQIRHRQQQINVQQYVKMKNPQFPNLNKKPNPNPKKGKQSDIYQSHIASHTSFQRQVITDEQLQFRNQQHFRLERQKMNFYTKTVHLNNHVYTSQEIVEKLRKYNKDSSIIFAQIDTSNINMLKRLQQQQLSPQNSMNISEYYDSASLVLVPLKSDMKTDNRQSHTTQFMRDSRNYKQQKQYVCAVYYVNDSAYNSNSRIRRRSINDKTLIEKVLDYFIYEVSRISRYTLDTQNSSSIIRKISPKPKQPQKPLRKEPQSISVLSAPIRKKSFSLFQYFGCCVSRPKKINSNPINKTQNYSNKV